MRNKVEEKGKKLKKAQKKGLYATMNGWRIGPFLLYQGYRWMALCGLMGRCMARVSSALKSTAKLRLYFHICKRFRGKVLDSQVLIGKNLRRLWELFLVPQISQMHTDFFA